MKILKNLWLLIAGIALISCAVEKEEDERTIEERVLAARMQVRYLDTLHKTESGMYYMTKAKGTGTQVQDENFVYVRFSTLDFSENYTGTAANIQDIEVAKQMGLYTPTTYYGPIVWVVANYAQPLGLHEILLDMRVGDRRRIWIPSRLSAYEGGAPQISSTQVYDIEILNVIKDLDAMKEYEIANLEAYRDQRYPGVDSLSFGLYKKPLLINPEEGDTLKVGDKVKMWYIGRTLDDFVFDTNIADTAKKYSIFNSEGDYVGLEYECKEDEVLEMLDTNGQSAGAIPGFCKAVFSMRYKEEAIFFFYSDLGYGAEGTISSGGQIQPFTPLVFRIKIEPRAETEE
jgi:FKBP-type peptidyl-prolyl cis-trans isomerases 1